MRCVRLALSFALVTAALPSEAAAQMRGVAVEAVRGTAGFYGTSSPSTFPLEMPSATAISPMALSGVVLPTASLTPSVQSLIAPSAMRTTVPSAVKPLAPKALLSQASVRLASSLRPGHADTLEAKRVSDAVFSGAASKESKDDDSSVEGAESSVPSALAPSSNGAKPRREPLVARWKAAMTGGAGPLVIASFVWNFLAIGAYSIIGPARGALLMTKFGPDTLPWVYMASAALTGLVVAVYGRFSKAPRKLLIGSSLAALAVTLVGGALAVSAFPVPAVSFGYFLWTDVFGIMSTTLFWTYANDVFTHDESKRTFGLIAAGGPLGSIAGALAMKLLVGSMGPVPMLLVAAGVFSLVIPVFFFLESRSQGRGAAVDPKPAAGKPAHAQGILKTIASSPFLVFLTLIVALERLVPDITNYLYSSAAVSGFAGDPKGMAQFFADVNFWTSVASFATSSLLVGLTLRRLGTAGSLMTAGLANLLFFAVFPFYPALGVAAVFFGLDGITRYTWFKTAKESTYSAEDRDVIYRVKAFVEMFVYRFSRGVAGLLLLGVTALGWGTTGVALLGVPLALLWLYASWRLGRESDKLEDARKDAKN